MMIKKIDTIIEPSEQLVKKELFHREFTSVLNTFLENSLNMPILIQGPRNSGKKTIASQISAYLGRKPQIFNFGNTTINSSPYLNIDALILEFNKSQSRGDLIVIEDLDKMQVYDYIVLLSLVKRIYNDSNNNFNSRMIILEDSNFHSTTTLSDSIKNKCKVIRIDKDPVIESKRQKELSNKKVKEKIKKGNV